MARRRRLDEMPPEARAAILAAMARKAATGDAKAAKLVIDEQRATAEQAEPVKILIDV